MLRPKGYATITDPADPVVEYDTCNCGHCQRIIFTKPGSAQTVYLFIRQHEVKEEMGAFCRVCMRPVCLQCHDMGTCTPWERQIEQMEARRRFLEAVGG